MAITFPLNPADGQLHNMGGIVYVYKLTDDKWVAQSSINSGSGTTPPVNDIYFGMIAFDANTGSLVAARNDGFVGNTNIDGRYVKLSGDTMTGSLILNANPVLPLGAATKAYVDSVVAAEIYTANATLDSTTGILTQTRTDGSTYNVNLFTGLDARYVNVAGDTMTGPLTVNSNLTVTGNTAVTNITASGNTVLNGDVYTTSNLYSNNVTISGNTVINGTLTANSIAIPLSALSDVSVAAPTSGQVLTYDANTSLWQATSLPAGTADTFLSNLTFDANTLVLTAFNSDGTTHSVTIPNNDKFVNAVSFDANTRVMTIARNDGNTFTSTIPDADAYVNTVTFNNTTRILSIVRNDGNTFTSFIPDADTNTVATNLAFNANTNVLTLTNSDASVLTANVALALNSLTNVETAPVDGQVLTYNAANTTWIATTPTAGSLSLGDLTNVDGEADDIGTSAFLVRNTAGLWRAGGVELNQLSDVEATLPANGQVLTYNTANSTWIATSMSSGGIQFSNTASTFNGVPRYSDLTGQFVKNSSVTIGDQGDLTATSVQTGSLQLEGFYRAKFNTLAGGFPTVNLDWKGTTYYKLTLATGNAPTIAFVNVPLPGYVATMTLEVLCSGGTMTWPANVKFPEGGSAPTLTTGKTYLFMLSTSDAGVTVLASTLNNY